MKTIKIGTTRGLSHLAETKSLTSQYLRAVGAKLEKKIPYSVWNSVFHWLDEKDYLANPLILHYFDSEERPRGGVLIVAAVNGEVKFTTIRRPRTIFDGDDVNLSRFLDENTP